MKILRLFTIPLLLGALLLTFSLQALADPLYEDFAESMYINNFEAIYQLTKDDILTGYPDGTFGPEEEINRAELAKALVLSTGMTDDEIKDAVDQYVDTVGAEAASFTDVDATLSVDELWYVDYVIYMKSQGWISGYPDGSFGAGNSVTAAEALKMVVESQWGTPSDHYVGDQWYERYFNMLEYFGFVYDSSELIMFSFSTSLGYPEDAITRSQLAELLYRVRSVLAENNGRFSGYGVYFWPIEEYEYTYNATFTENGDGTFDIEDSYFGFALRNVPLGDFELEDLYIYMVKPSGASHGYETLWYVMYPLDPDVGLYYDNYEHLFDVTIRDAEYHDESNLDLYFSLDFSQEDYGYLLGCSHDNLVSEELSELHEATCEYDSYGDIFYDMTIEAVEIDHSIIYDQFAQCLTNSGLVFYGVDWCPYCADQEELFGDSFEYIDYVECTEEVDLCLETEITAYPTWIDAEGEHWVGLAELETLGEISGACVLPD